MGKMSKRYRGRDRSWKVRALVRRDGSRCALCGVDLAMHDITLDHIVPFSRGGGDSIENLQIACEPCNRAKDAMTQEEWDEMQGRVPA